MATFNQNESWWLIIFLCEFYTISSSGKVHTKVLLNIKNIAAFGESSFLRLFEHFSIDFHFIF